MTPFTIWSKPDYQQLNWKQAAKPLHNVVDSNEKTRDINIDEKWYKAKQEVYKWYFSSAYQV